MKQRPFPWWALAVLPLMLALVTAGGVDMYARSGWHLFWYILVVLFFIGCIVSETPGEV